MTRPNRRSALIPTRREVTHTVAFVLGAWVALGIRELLSHTWLNATPPEAQRVAAMTAMNLSRMSAETNARNNGPRIDLGVHRHDGEKWGRA